MNKFASIPTLYNGIQFRSRLEAKWAAFFDALDWQWSYEPFDLDGWIPDFSINAARAPLGEVLVEVKPIRALDLYVCDKIDRAAPGHAVLIVGVSPLSISIEDGTPAPGGEFCAGWLRRGEREFFDWQGAYFTYRHGQYGFSSSPVVNADLVNSDGYASDDNSPLLLSEVAEIRQLWNTASNLVQWRRPC